MSTSPLGSCTWPAQKKSSGVGITWKVPLLGLYTADSNVPAANSFGSLPEPATNRTSPLYSTTEWMDLTGEGNGRTCQAPLVHAAPAVQTLLVELTVASAIE